MVGRKPKPTAIKQLAGNPGKRPLNDAEPQPRRIAPPVPRGRLPAAGRRAWRRLSGVLDPLGLLTEADAEAFELLCMHYALALDAYAVLQEEGLVALSAKGTLVRHPAAGIFRENATSFRLMAVEFGLTPSSRSRLSVPEAEEPSLAEMLFAGVIGDDD